MKKTAKKLAAIIAAAGLGIFAASSVSAQNMEMYVSGHYTIRDIQNVGGIDMVPIEEIAPELGFTTWFDGNELTLYGTDRTYWFHINDANVWDNAGGWSGLDVTPRVIDGKVRIPVTWLVNTLGMNYTYDWVTNMLFINSDYTYNWLINTPEYKDGILQKQRESWLWSMVGRYSGDMINLEVTSVAPDHVKIAWYNKWATTYYDAYFKSGSEDRLSAYGKVYLRNTDGTYYYDGDDDYCEFVLDPHITEDDEGDTIISPEFATIYVYETDGTVTQVLKQ